MHAQKVFEELLKDVTVPAPAEMNEKLKAPMIWTLFRSDKYRLSSRLFNEVIELIIEWKSEKTPTLWERVKKNLGR